MRLPEFIDKYYNGVQAKFARAIGVIPPSITKYLKRGNCHVYKINGDYILMNETKNLSEEIRKVKSK